MTKLITTHWYRCRQDESVADPCVHPECGRPLEDHAEAVGEWYDPKHFYWPMWGGCATCGRSWHHSTHWGSRKNRSMWVWPAVLGWFLRTKDRIMRRDTCIHFSHRLRLPCLRRLRSCSGLCEHHYDDCSEGCP